MAVENCLKIFRSSHFRSLKHTRILSNKTSTQKLYIGAIRLKNAKNHKYKMKKPRGKCLLKRSLFVCLKNRYTEQFVFNYLKNISKIQHKLCFCMYICSGIVEFICIGSSSEQREGCPRSEDLTSQSVAAPNCMMKHDETCSDIFTVYTKPISHRCA